MLEKFMANAIKLPIESPQLDFFESIFDKSTLSSNIEPAILNQLEKW